MDQVTQVREKLLSLEAALLEKLPEMPTILRSIHKQLKADPEVVTLLTEEECSLLVRGLKKQTGAVIATAAIKGGKKAMSKMTVEDL